MYRKILVALENSRTDKSLLAHVQQLAGLAHSQLLLLHVADGWAARNFNSLKLAESEEMKADRTYLENTAESLRTAGLIASVQLALGDPPAEIIKTAERENCDLIAMGSHGHKLVGDLVFGSTINKVRHDTDIPVLLVREIK
ncbi:MAG TPA: universal stress protein [Verrucomicrobiae bacterium]